MSLRKPKSLIIRHDNEESSGEEVIEKAPVRSKFVGTMLRLLVLTKRLQTGRVRSRGRRLRSTREWTRR
jgi:hypothetical protein